MMSKSLQKLTSFEQDVSQNATIIQIPIQRWS